MQIYDQDSKPLADLLAEASSEQGATLLVPDLQRPYVWSPNQVTLLVDSLLRGWPFGTLLLWEMRSDHVASIPSRPFWRVVDRTRGDVNDEQVSRSHPPATFRMVLDPETETFENDAEANALRTREEYRKPWELPKI